jgi:thiol-disulfide isomerase/thioredoxin
LVNIPYFRHERWREEQAAITLPATLLSRDSTVVTPLSLAGKVTYIDFWSKFCGSCRQEMPYLVEVAEHFKSQPDFQIIALDAASFDSFQQFRTADKFHAYPIRMYYDPDTLLTHEHEIHGLPVGLLVDRKGIVRHRQSGFRVWEGPYRREDLVEEVERLLAE